MIPLRGYYFEVLTRQGENPSGGAYDYVINGNMLAGFALVAYPADYGNTGVMTFVVNHRGRIYQKDLGSFDGMDAYNPAYFSLISSKIGCDHLRAAQARPEIVNSEKAIAPCRCRAKSSSCCAGLGQTSSSTADIRTRISFFVTFQTM